MSCLKTEKIVDTTEETVQRSNSDVIEARASTEEAQETVTKMVEPVTLEPVTSESVPSEAVTSETVVSAPMMLEPVASAPVTSEGVTSTALSVDDLITFEMLQIREKQVLHDVKMAGASQPATPNNTPLESRSKL